jgi:calcineurin-like phosphoesterase family protein
MTVWFTSDLHFRHKNILKYNPDTRQYVDHEDMREKIILEWNSRVKAEDTVYHLGDFSFGSKTYTSDIIKELKGTINFIRGNHDQNWLEPMVDYQEIRIEGQKIVLFHFPIGSWHGQCRGTWHLHGHCHGSYADSKGKMLDVGWDNVGAKLISFEEIKVLMDKQEININDHH